MPTVLVADDNRNVQKMVTLALQEEGIEVVAVTHGEAAVKKLSEVQPDVVLADVFMPVRDGYEVCEYVKGDARYAHIPVILLIGENDLLDKERVRRVGADEVLTKPFVASDLVSSVKAALEKLAREHPEKVKRPAPAEKTQQLTMDEIARITAKKAAEKTQLMSAEEIRALLGQAAAEAAAKAEPEPEVEQYATQAPKIEVPEEVTASAFADLLEAPPAEEAPAEAPAVEETIAAPAEARAEPAPEEVPEAPTWGGIEAEPRQPSPDEPPIRVEFGPSEPMELVTDESHAASALVEAGPLPELASTPTEWMAAAAPAATPPATVEPPPPAPAAEAPPEEAFAVPAVEAPPPAEPEVEVAPERAVSFPPQIEIAARAPAAARVEARVELFPVPQPLDPKLVDEIVERVIDKVQVQILQAVREIVRAAVETVLRREFEKE